MADLKALKKNAGKGKPPAQADASVTDAIAENDRKDEVKREPGKWGQLNIKTADAELPKAFKKWCVNNDMTMGEAFQEAFELLKAEKAG